MKAIKIGPIITPLLAVSSSVFAQNPQTPASHSLSMTYKLSDNHTPQIKDIHILLYLTVNTASTTTFSGNFFPITDWGAVAAISTVRDSDIHSCLSRTAMDLPFGPFQQGRARASILGGVTSKSMADKTEAPTIQQTSTISLTLSPIENHLDLGRPVVETLTVKNTGTYKLLFLQSAPLTDYTILVTKSDGTAMPITESGKKILSDSAYNMRVHEALDPGAVATLYLNLSELYDFSKVGVYQATVSRDYKVGLDRHLDHVVSNTSEIDVAVPVSTSKKPS